MTSDPLQEARSALKAAKARPGTLASEVRQIDRAQSILDRILANRQERANRDWSK